MKIRIILDIDGGVLQAVYSNSSEVAVELIDWDNMRAEPDATVEEDGLGLCHVGVLSDPEFEAKRNEIIAQCEVIVTENKKYSIGDY